jgi:hypothetical protein
MRCDAYSREFKWSMQSYEFQADSRILKLGKYDMVLRVYWLKIYSQIIFDFIKENYH